MSRPHSPDSDSSLNEVEKHNLLHQGYESSGSSDQEAQWTREAEKGRNAGPKKWREQLINVLIICMNTVATIAVVFLNKKTLTDTQLQHFQAGTAATHFLTTFALLLAVAYMRTPLLSPIRLPALSVLPLSFVFAASIMLSNWSLYLNPIGFFQLAKALNTPALVALSFALYRERVSAPRLAAVGLSCAGVALASATSFASNAVGLVAAGAAVLATATYQLVVKRKTTELNHSAQVLLLNQSVYAVPMLLPVSLLVDTWPDFRQVSPAAWTTFAGGSVVAAVLNLSQFMIIGRTSALTFNIVSNAKMVAILALSWATERKAFGWPGVLGVHLALLGGWLYWSYGERERPGR